MVHDIAELVVCEDLRYFIDENCLTRKTRKKANYFSAHILNQKLYV